MINTDKAYKIEDDPICGRQLVAKRKIHAGELIIDEPALLAGPGFARGNNAGSHLVRNSSKSSMNSTSSKESLADFVQEDVSVCLVCCANLNPSSSTPCPSCELFLCSEHCKSNVLHTQNECLIFPKIWHVWKSREQRSKKSLYNLVLVIRGLFYKFRDITKWTQIKSLDSKSEALSKVGGFVDLEDIFSSLTWEMFASLPCSASAKQEETDNDDDKNITQGESIIEAARHCLGVMRINAFSSFSESYSREGLFFISSFMSHCCVINTDRQIGVNDAGDGVRMVVRASVDIEKGQPITTTYLSLLYSTEERHRIMIRSWLFVCKCKRCKDHLECQAFSGAITCQKKLMDGGRLVVICDSTECPCQDDKESTIKKISEARPTDLYDVPKVEAWLDAYDTGLLIHTNHSVFAHVKLFLCQFYGRQNGGLDMLSVSQVKRKVLYCLQLLKLYDRTCPGFQMYRGVLMFELWCGLRKLLQSKELPFTIKYIVIPESAASNPNSVTLSKKDIAETKKSALKILQFALPNSQEEDMKNVLTDEED